ncbi:hypothetical protein PRUPE_1G379900 [Prunus persica]|uniref:Uncharacterized protein n=1 Tax=Prunus persica TaxID=3760 RepID=A0A251RAD2_PRUPE|nr:hypothetical protein PRUPE_1G379900 [Prunus persica]
MIYILRTISNLVLAFCTDSKNTIPIPNKEATILKHKSQVNSTRFFFLIEKYNLSDFAKQSQDIPGVSGSLLPA